MRSVILTLYLLALPVAAADWLGCRLAVIPATAEDWSVRVLFGCRGEDQVPQTWVYPFSWGALTRLRTEASRFLGNEPIGPVSLPVSRSAGQCERFWLWAEDEAWPGSMTREEKLRAACF